MAKGKSLCKLLKKIREQIAEANGIDYASRKCTFEGDCKGTCPACERELEYLESQLTMKRSMGVPIKIIGLSVALASGTACTSNPPETCPPKEITLDSVDYVDEIPAYPITEEDDDSSDTQSYPNDSVIISGCIVPNSDPNPIYYEQNECEKRAHFPGGVDSLTSFLQKNLNYPQKALNEGIKGRVYVQFIIEMDGSISKNVNIVHGIDPLLDAEAVRLVKSMPNWIPAEKEGKIVRSIDTLPVIFKYH